MIEDYSDERYFPVVSKELQDSIVANRRKALKRHAGNYKPPSGKSNERLKARKHRLDVKRCKLEDRVLNEMLM